MRVLGRGPCLAALILLGAVGAAWASIYFPPVSPDLSGYALQAQVPQPCPTVPLPDTLNGTLGTATPCTLRPDTARPTVVQAANVVTDGSGNWAVIWAKSFVSPVPAVNPLPVNTGTLPVLCNVQTRSATGATGRCWQSNTNTLPGTVTALAGLVLNVFAAGAANVPVMVIAREPTQ